MPAQNPASDEKSHPAPETLIEAAQHEEARPTRSRLEPCASVIFILREKRWSFAAIAAWLAQHGIHAAESTVSRFYRNRSHAGAEGLTDPSTASHRPSSFFDSTHEKPQTRPGRSPTEPAGKPKFNTNF